MSEKDLKKEFMEILSEKYGADPAYFEDPETVRLLLNAMMDAFNLGKKVERAQSISV